MITAVALTVSNIVEVKDRTGWVTRAELFTKSYMVQLRSTWSMTVSSSLPPVDVNFDRQKSIRVSFNALALISVIAPSLSLDHVCGTVSLLNFATSTSPSDSSVVR